jgi:hypothetical protein
MHIIYTRSVHGVLYVRVFCVLHVCALGPYASHAAWNIAPFVHEESYHSRKMITVAPAG